MFKHHHQDPASPSERAAFVQHLLELARHYEGTTGADAGASPVPLKKNERLLFVVPGAALVEPRRDPGHWQGRNQGLSIPIPYAHGIRYRIGATHGTYVQGTERPTPIDAGTVSITTTRAVFVGPKQTREWAWSKLLGITHEQDAPWTAIAVSNRQKTSGILYDEANTELIRFYLDLAVAIANDNREPLIHELAAELENLLSQLPPPPAAP
jgi:hypothetical protein